MYNAEKDLWECYNSIKSQSFQDFEIVFVDDCSTDSSPSILEEIKELDQGRVIIVHNNINSGAAFSRNQGMLLSSGDYLLFIDADDCIVPSCLSLFSNAVIQYDNPDLVIANVDCPQYKYRKFENRYVNSNQEIRKIYFAHGVFEMPWNKLIRRDFLFNNKLFFMDACYYEDTLWSFQVTLHANTVVLLPEVTYYYKTNSTQKSAMKDVEFISSEKVKVFQEMKNSLYPGDYDANEYLIDISNSFLLSCFSLSVSPNSLRNHYNSIKQLFTASDAFSAIVGKHLSLGMKGFVLHLLFPRPLGYYYAKMYSLIVAK